jgi:hypothetical protein
MEDEVFVAFVYYLSSLDIQRPSASALSICRKRGQENRVTALMDGRCSGEGLGRNGL